MAADVRLVLTDIEGTTTPISFVHDVLFPAARARLPALVGRGPEDPEIGPVLERVRAIAPEGDPLETLLGWMDRDEKIEPLKTLQGIAWRDGYADGSLRGELYPDVAPSLAAWRRAGLRLAVYSSGSEAAQRLLFGHTGSGDLVPLFEGFFDTRVGGKREAASYRAICLRVGLAAGVILFLSDVEAELDAAAAAGLRTCQLVRPRDGTVASARHAVASDFAAILPAAVAA